MAIEDAGLVPERKRDDDMPNGGLMGDIYPLAEEMARVLETVARTVLLVDGCRYCGSAEDGKHFPDCDLARLLQVARDSGLLAGQPDRRAEP